MLRIADIEYLQTIVKFADIGKILYHKDCYSHASVCKLPDLFENDPLAFCPLNMGADYVSQKEQEDGHRDSYECSKDFHIAPPFIAFALWYNIYLTLLI
jgi:hypothetical protein